MGVQSDFNLDRLRLDITPPNTTAYCSNGQVCGEVDNVIASIVFSPHSTIPRFRTCVDRVTSKSYPEKDSMEQDSTCDETHVKYELTGRSVILSCLLPSKFQEKITRDNDKVPFIDLNVMDTFLKEEIISSQSLEVLHTQDLICCTEAIHFELKKSNILGQYGHRYILQQIMIETKGGILSLHWSPVVQWFIISAVKKIISIVIHYGTLFNQRNEKLVYCRRLYNI